MNTTRIRIGAMALFVLVIAVLLSAPRNENAPPSLRIGDPAPALTVGDWIKGEPVEALEKGRVHVVEFWATWCAPCRTSVPHLTRLQGKHPDAVFIGVAVSDKTARVKAFVEKMGDTMDYRVAVEDGHRTSTAWMQAAGIGGIPAVFVVDKAGRIAWIGHPLDDAFETAVETALKAGGAE